MQTSNPASLRLQGRRGLSRSAEPRRTLEWRGWGGAFCVPPPPPGHTPPPPPRLGEGGPAGALATGVPMPSARQTCGPPRLGGPTQATSPLAQLGTVFIVQRRRRILKSPADRFRRIHEQPEGRTDRQHAAVNVEG